MKPLLGVYQLNIETKIVREFGDGVLRGDRPLFDQIGLPEGWSERRVSPTELVSIVRQRNSVIVLFDRNPDNYRLTIECLQKLNLPLVPCAEVDADELGSLLTCQWVDMYVTTEDGRLLAAPCHEDPEVNGVRQIWMPIPPPELSSKMS